jgi:hypothetical protein
MAVPEFGVTWQWGKPEVEKRKLVCQGTARHRHGLLHGCRRLHAALVLCWCSSWSSACAKNKCFVRLKLKRIILLYHLTAVLKQSVLMSLFPVENWAVDGLKCPCGMC